MSKNSAADGAAAGDAKRAKADEGGEAAAAPAGGAAGAGGAAAFDMVQILEGMKPRINAALEKVVPREFTQEFMREQYGEARYAYDVETLTNAISTPTWDILDRGGKRWRPALLLLIAEALGGSVDTAMAFVALCEIVHNGTLVVDDIEDSSELRRGKKCIHHLYGIDVAINAGNAMYYLPLTVLKKRNTANLSAETLIACYEVYSQEMINLHFGQGLDIWWHSGKKEGDEPTEAHYLQMCAFKTGTLARLSAKVSALICGADEAQVEAIGKFAETIGVAFQIQDDILNLVGDEFGKQKGVGEDIHEGKRTLMALHCLANASAADADELRGILRAHPDDQKTIMRAIDIIKSTDSINYARSRAKELMTGAWDEIAPLLKESDAKKKLHAFARYLIDRKI